MSETILAQLVDLSRYLGAPEKGYAILGEGNSSARVDSDTFFVKASGTTMASIEAGGFVHVRKGPVLEILDDPAAGDDHVDEVLRACLVVEGETRRPSVETMLHASLLEYPEIHFVGHTHPEYTNMLLCSKNAQEAVAGRVFPDQIVSMGHKSVYVPYVDPGLVLAREVRDRVAAFVETEGLLPKCIMMENHGFIALGDSPKAVTSCTDMAEKSSRILVGAYSVGGPNFLSDAHVDRIFTRPDEHYRLKHIAS